MAYMLGQAVGGTFVTFIVALVVTFLIKKLVIVFAKAERKECIQNNFLILRTSMMFAGAAACLNLIGISNNAIGYYGLPVIIVVDFIIANSK